jgi:NADH-quinone oxidoreductase subunit E
MSSAERGTPDALQRLTGVDAELEAALHSLGLYYYSQFADWSPEQVAYVEQRIAKAAGKAGQWSAEVRALLGEKTG